MRAAFAPMRERESFGCNCVTLFEHTWAASRIDGTRFIVWSLSLQHQGKYCIVP